MAALSTTSPNGIPNDNTKAHSVSSSSMAAPDAHAGPSSAARASDLTLSIDSGKFMTLQTSNLVVEGDQPVAAKHNTICGIPFGYSSTRSIPLFNVLWAERNGSVLEITFAEPSGGHKFRPVHLSVDVSSNGDASTSEWIEALMQRAYGRAKRQKRAKVLVNPHAGPGGAMGKWHQDAEPLFKAARMSIDMQKTTHSGEAIGITRDLNIDDFDTIVACSGDGLPHEIFNGLGQRPDAGRALAKIAVSQIPCGSGNGMSCTLYGSGYVSEAALGIIKGVDTPFDLVSMTQGTVRTLSFLSQCVGLMAEADLGTEHMRWMGGARFHVGVLMRLLKKKSFPCDMDLKVEVDDKTAIKRAYKKHIEQQKPDGVPGGQAADSLELPPLKYGTVNDPLPQEGWEHIKYDNMGTFFCGNMTTMAADTFFFPAATPDDGLMDLVTIDSNVPVVTALGIMDNIGDEGTFFDHPLVQYRKISAFRFTPRDQDHGYISIDGEKVPFAPFQAEVHPKLGRVYALEGRYACGGPRGWRQV
ncbi:diacylglycerol kinase catalytic domain-containing protein [Plectosphaerella plurivora]|uniref:Diacylglycerol kinase catalytic domain-containing protein n=1 Tax=Plectosphaerella plurivora TaxID=936078 RepID=A0A9P8VKB0_9PEZI|nr:diacylglycerol kinase catalytic domain-containing protein [Plectosphaerella plurivora]